MQVSEDPCGYNVKLEVNDFYICRYCATPFVKLNPLLLDKTKPSPCMFCGKFFVCPADRDYHMCFHHENEDMPVIRCFHCGDTFVCIHEKQRHLCISKPESETAGEKKKQILPRLPKCLIKPESETAGEKKKQILPRLPNCLIKK